jgi:hypothetical protein
MQVSAYLISYPQNSKSTFKANVFMILIKCFGEGEATCKAMS